MGGTSDKRAHKCKEKSEVVQQTHSRYKEKKGDALFLILIMEEFPGVGAWLS